MIISSSHLNSKQISLMNPATTKPCFQEGSDTFPQEIASHSPPPSVMLLFAICSELPTPPSSEFGIYVGGGEREGLTGDPISPGSEH